jgi:hypothetical protein
MRLLPLFTGGHFDMGEDWNFSEREWVPHSHQHAFGVALHTTQELAFTVFLVESKPNRAIYQHSFS